jgi:hypothetical protein
MRILTAILLFAGLGTGLSAQDQPQPSGKFYGPLANHSWTAKPLPNAQQQEGLRKLASKFFSPRETLIVDTSKCAIPLVEMSIPKDTTFEIGTIVPPPDRAEASSVAKSLLPPCPQESTPWLWRVR